MKLICKLLIRHAIIAWWYSCIYVCGCKLYVFRLTTDFQWGRSLLSSFREIGLTIYAYMQSQKPGSKSYYCGLCQETVPERRQRKSILGDSAKLQLSILDTLSRTISFLVCWMYIKPWNLRPQTISISVTTAKVNAQSISSSRKSLRL
jgi:hypothetical protein